MTENPISVLITGASSGIGRTIAADLSRSGHQVFASVRKEADAEALRSAIPEIVPVVFDVTDSQGIQQAFSFIQARRRPELPFSIVNNAGIAVAGPLEDLSNQDLKNP